MLAMLIKFIQRFSSKEVVVRGTRYILSKNVFHPKYFYTSEFMAENMEIKEGSIVLDMGTGSGIIAIEASRKASIVVAVDVNPEAIEIARKNAEINGRNNIIFIKSNLFSSIPPMKFDAILFNPPYLEGKPKSYFDYAIYDYKKSIIKNFLRKAKNYLKDDGHIEIVYSSISSPLHMVKYAERIGWKVKKMAEKEIRKEKIYLFKLFWH